MKHINELSQILNYHLNWNKARVTCLAQMIRSIIAVKSVNLPQIAIGFCPKSKSESSYKRTQRFLRFFNFDLSLIVKIVFAIFPLPRKMILIMDRTNWKWEKTHINILVLSITYHGVSIPIFWYNLAKTGNSKTKDRIKIVSKVLNFIGPNKIKYLLADKEFVGNEWFDWLVKTKGEMKIRDKGTPQEGVISPLLSNLFLHYIYDLWMKRNHPDSPWCRCADNGLAHCRTELEAKQLLNALRDRFAQCGLELHPNKTKIIYCKDTNRKGKIVNKSFDFLGYTFRCREARNPKCNKLFESFSPAVSKSALNSIRQKTRKLHWRNRTGLSIEEISKLYNPVLVGWNNYYGRYYKSEMGPIWSHFNRILVK